MNKAATDRHVGWLHPVYFLRFSSSSTAETFERFLPAMNKRGSFKGLKSLKRSDLRVLLTWKIWTWKKFLAFYSSIEKKVTYLRRIYSNRQEKRPIRCRNKHIFSFSASRLSALGKQFHPANQCQILAAIPVNDSLPVCFETKKIV